VIDLSARLEAEGGLKAASSFASRAAAERGVAGAISEKAGEIATWLAGRSSRLVLNANLERGLG
jgi:hypothetical protein